MRGTRLGIAQYDVKVSDLFRVEAPTTAAGVAPKRRDD